MSGVVCIGKQCKIILFAPLKQIKLTQNLPTPVVEQGDGGYRFDLLPAKTGRSDGNRNKENYFLYFVLPFSSTPFLPFVFFHTFSQTVVKSRLFTLKEQWKQRGRFLFSHRFLLSQIVVIFLKHHCPTQFFRRLGMAVGLIVYPFPYPFS